MIAKINEAAIQRAYENLGNAVVEQAAKDYRQFRKIPRRKKKKPTKGTSVDTRWNLEEVTKFFKSSRINLFTGLDGMGILRMLEDEYERNHKKST